MGYNTINNAEEAVHMVDVKNTTLANNTFLLSRARGINIIQSSTGAVSGNAFNANSLLQKNPDYPYIEMNDMIDNG